VFDLKRKRERNCRVSLFYFTVYMSYLKLSFKQNATLQFLDELLIKNIHQQIKDSSKIMITSKKSKLLFFLLFTLQIINETMSSHFRGGTISWSPVNPTASPSATYVEVAITTRFFWAIATQPACDSTPEIADHALIGDNTSITPLTGPASWYINSQVNCYDLSLSDGWSAGVRTQIVNVSTQVEVIANYTSCCWVTGVTSVSGSTSWSLPFTINLKGA
jgi:hypothetical protein